MTNNNIKKYDETAFKVIGYAFITLWTVLAILPFYLLVMASFTDEQSLFQSGLSLWPSKFSMAAYELIFSSPQKLFNAYKVSIIVTFVGTVAGLFLTSMSAYVLNNKSFKYRNSLAFFFYFTTLFGAGMVPTYIWISRYLHMKNSILVLIVPSLLSVFNILMLRNFVKGIPDEIMESGKIDGAGEFTIFFKLYLPLMKSGLACIALFIGLGYWNSWSNAMLYVDDEKLFPLQYLLYRMTASTEGAAGAISSSGIVVSDMPTQSLKYAMTIVTVIPIVFVYPFVQKHFVRGITVGAVKG